MLEQNRFEANLLTYNTTHLELSNILCWWASLSSIEQANPQKFGSLVRQVERALQTEADSIFPGALSVKFEGGSKDDNNSRAAIDVQGLVQDIKESCKGGQIVFKNTWVDKNANFFSQYNEWCVRSTIAR